MNNNRTYSIHTDWQYSFDVVQTEREYGDDCRRRQTGGVQHGNQRHQRQIAMGLVEPEWDLPGPGPEVQPWAEAPNKDWQDLRMAVYAAMVDRADLGIGRILQKLDRSGVADRTEMHDLADKFPERVKDLSEKWFAWANQTGVKVSRRKKKKTS